jgi:hypothetical protein
LIAAIANRASAQDHVIAFGIGSRKTEVVIHAVLLPAHAALKANSVWISSLRESTIKWQETPADAGVSCDVPVF